MKALQKILSAFGLTVTMAAFASANAITVNCSVTSGPTELGVATSGTVSCPGDSLPASDTITGIVITIDGAIIAPSDITLDNMNLTSQTGSATAVSVFTLATALPGASFASPFLTVNAGTGTTTVAAGATVTTPVTGSSSVAQSVTGAGNFAFYENPFTFTGDTMTNLNVNFTGGNVTATEATDASLTATVQYTFTPASPSNPEPATMVLMGSVLVGLGLLRRRVKS